MISPSALVDAVRSDRLHLILLPTEQCNLRCTYCYEDFQLPRMSPGVLGGIKKLLTNRGSSLNLLDVSWFGGEPLVAYDAICEVMEHAGQLARTHSNLQVRSDITTNAYTLTKERFGKLVGLGISQYQIALDGPSAVHDSRRGLAGGGGTFERIWSNLLATREHHSAFRIQLRIHVAPDTAGSLEPLLEEIAAEFGGDRRYRVTFKLLSRWGGPNDGEIVVFKKEAGRQAVRRLQARAFELGLADPEPAADGPFVCYATKPNSLLIRSDGTIGKCTLALHADGNRLGSLGEDGSIAVDARRLSHWSRGLISGNAKELSCPWGGWEAE